MTKTFLSKEDELIAKLTDLGVPTSEINLCIDAAEGWVDIIASRNNRTLRRITMRDFCQLTWIPHRAFQDVHVGRKAIPIRKIRNIMWAQ